MFLQCRRGGFLRLETHMLDGRLMKMIHIPTLKNDLGAIHPASRTASEVCFRLVEEAAAASARTLLLRQVTRVAAEVLSPHTPPTRHLTLPAGGMSNRSFHNLNLGS